MAISDCWDFNFSAKVISHIDGVLSYDAGSGTQPAVGQMIIGATSGAIGKILAETGDETAGTLTLTNVVGLFEDGETLDQLSYLDFDTVDNGGFKIGDTIVDQVSGTMDVKFIEYNIDGVAGHGRAFGTNFTAFTDDSQIDISGGQTAVAAADGTGTDNDTAWDADVDGTLAVPGTTNTNNCIIIHFDGGSIAIPDDAHISDASSGAEGYAQKVFGSVSEGSIRVVDSDTTGGSWTDDNTLRIEDVIYYDTLVAGKVFSEGDVIKAVNGTSPDAVGRVLAVIDDGDNTGKLILANFSGTWSDDNEIHVLQADDTYVKYAEVENTTNKYLDAATINIPDGVRDTQRDDQGGIYSGGSLNIVRSANAFYTYAQELFVQLGQLDDPPALEGNVRDQLYTILNDYVIPDLSFRFIEKGSFKDSGNNNIFTNYQSAGVVADVGDWAYFYDSSNPTPQPDIYMEQDGEVKAAWWLEGHIDILVKVKTSTDPAYINPSVEALGQLIDSGTVIFHVRPYLRTYDTAQVLQLGGIAPVFLANADDLNNTTGQYQAAFQTGSGTPFTEGEEATTSDGKRVLIVTSDSGATGNITYVLKSATNLIDTDTITGAVSGATAAINGSPSSLVAGYGTNIKVMTVQLKCSSTPDAVITGTFVLGELCTQATTGATGYFMEADSNELYLEVVSGTFSGDNTITGGVSGATWNPDASSQSYDSQTTVPKDIGGGVGDKNYTAVVSADITDSSPRPLSEVYEWFKWLDRKESTIAIQLPGTSAGSVEGRIFRRFVDTFKEVRGASPHGSKAGSLVIGCQGLFIDTGTLDSGDIRNIQLIDNAGGTYDPPNLQVLEVINLSSGVNVAVYRSTGSGSETILRNEFQVGAVGGGYNQSGDSDILVQAGGRSVSPLPQDVPDTGVLRVLDPNNTGDYLRFVYDTVDRTNNIFSLQQGIGQNTIGDVTGAQDLVQNDYAHVVFIEDTATGTSISNTIQFVSDAYLFAVARIKGKQHFKTTSVFGSGGVSIGAVLNPDNVVNLP